MIAIAVWLTIGESLAQAPRDAEAAFEQGRKLMAAKSYADACAAFELSQRLDPQYGTQFNLAGCYTALDKIATAWKLYQELARSDSNAPRGARSALIAKELAARVPKLRIRVDQQAEGLKVIVGATDVTSLVGADVPFDAGHYVVEATLPGYRPFREEEEIEVEAGGEAREIAIVFERDPALDPSTRRRNEEVGALARRKRYGAIAIAGGGGLVAIGLVAGWRALANRNTSRDLCNAAACPDRDGALSHLDRAQGWGTVSTVSVVLGVVGAAGGYYLWRTSSARLRRVGASAGPASASLVISGAF